MTTHAARRLLLTPGMRTPLTLTLTLSLLLLLLVGCGDSGSSDPGVCPMPDAIADAGSLTALKAQRCNVMGSMGQRKWYRLSATLPEGPIVQLELYDALGPFAGGTVRTGSFPVEAAYGNCGVCLRAISDKGMATETEFFATGGMVNITAIGAGGAPISATISGATFAEIEAGALVSQGCVLALAGARVDGTVMDVGGGGGGGGGGGSQCPSTVGD